METKYEMPALTEKEKSDVQNYARSLRDGVFPGGGGEYHRHIEKLTAQIALAALTTDVFQWYGSISGNTYQDKDGDPNRFPIYTAPPVPMQKAVNMPGRIANIHLRSPLEVEDMYRSFFKAAVCGAGYKVKE